MVTDMNGNPVESANVTFYVNSMAVYSELTNPRGTARVFGAQYPQQATLGLRQLPKMAKSGLPAFQRSSLNSIA